MKRRGSTLVVTLSTLVALSLLAAFTLMRVMPRIRVAYQNAAWQEARVGAEAGIDCALNDLNRNQVGFTKNGWSGWQDESSQGKGTTTTTTGQAGLLQQLTGTVDSTLGSLTSGISGNKGKSKSSGKSKSKKPGLPVTITAPIFLDNLKVSAVSSIATEVDVRLWGLQQDAAHTNWFRLRSMATCALPPAAHEAPVSLDAPLRRFSLHTVRPSLRRDDAGRPTTVPLPNVSRTVEALVEPILPFELALWSGHAVSLAPTGAWNIDSFDSLDDTKSNAGVYPGRKNALTQANGSLASGETHPYSTPYGPTILANGASVSGVVATNGGDDPATKEHENVTGALNIDPARIRSDFSREMPALTRPAVATPLPPPVIGPFLAGPVTAPTIYKVPGSLTGLRIAAPLGATSGGIVIMIDGDLDLAGALIVPDPVVALLFVRGNVTFRDNINSGTWSSNRASQLLIFGDGKGPDRQKLQALTGSAVCASFYGPNVDLVLDGSVHWMGSLAGASFRVNGGGDGGLHYDEALGTIGPPVGFRISRYVEDVRE